MLRSTPRQATTESAVSLEDVFQSNNNQSCEPIYMIQTWFVLMTNKLNQNQIFIILAVLHRSV